MVSNLPESSGLGICLGIELGRIISNPSSGLAAIVKLAGIVPVGTEVTPGDWELVENSSGELRSPDTENNPMKTGWVRCESIRQLRPQDCPPKTIGSQLERRSGTVAPTAPAWLMDSLILSFPNPVTSKPYHFQTLSLPNSVSL